MRLRRRSPSYLTRWKISQALRGRVVSKEAREKSSAAQKGRVFSEEHRRRLSEGQRERRAREASQDLMEVCRELSRARLRERGDRVRALWHRDLVKAQLLRNRELYQDVLQSWGWASKRKVKDPTGYVSDGYREKRYRFPGGGSWGIREYKHRRTGLGKPLAAPLHDLRDCKPVGEDKKKPFWMNKQKGVASPEDKK